MTQQPAVIPADATVRDAAELMRTRGVGMLPVVEAPGSRRLVGVITDRDIVLRHVALGHGQSAKVRDHMTREPLVTASPHATVNEVAERMMLHQVRRLPVVDAMGMLLGVIAQADLAVAVGPTDAAFVERLIEGISRPGALVK